MLSQLPTLVHTQTTVETNNGKLQLQKAIEGPRHILSGTIHLKIGHGGFAK